MKKKYIDSEAPEAPSLKKLKSSKEKQTINNKTDSSKKLQTKPSEISKYSKDSKIEAPTKLKKVKPKTLAQKGTTNFVKAGKSVQAQEKPEDWNEFKKQKKELKLKRKQIKAKDGFDVIIKAKKLGEELRRKSLKGGEVKRLQLVNELHAMLRGKGHYPKFVLAHDTARLVQWLLKYGSNIIVQQIAKVCGIVPFLVCSIISYML